MVNGTTPLVSVGPANQPTRLACPETTFGTAIFMIQGDETKADMTVI
jgi:hypothetical protein